MNDQRFNAIVAFAIEVTADDFYQQCDGNRIDYLFGQHGLENEIKEKLKRECHVGFSRIEANWTIYLFYPLESLQSAFGSPARLNVDAIHSNRTKQWEDELRRAFDEILHLRYSDPEWKIAVENL